MTTFVLATANPDKAREIAAVLTDEAPSLELVARPPEVPDVDEVGDTLEDNARIKAVALCAATALPAVADDTGLHVDALDGALEYLVDERRNVAQRELSVAERADGDLTDVVAERVGLGGAAGLGAGGAAF